uniref:hypothetical protein n=1 Tax=Paenibacillus xylanexedens TaxID=528191 RepID=UPI001C92DB43
EMCEVSETGMKEGVIEEKDGVVGVGVMWGAVHGVIDVYVGGEMESEEGGKKVYEDSVRMIMKRVMKGCVEG